MSLRFGTFLTSEIVLGQANVGKALAFGMIPWSWRTTMSLRHAAEENVAMAAVTDASLRRGFGAAALRWAVLLSIGAFMLLPLAAMLEFSTRGIRGARSLRAWTAIGANADLLAAIWVSLELAALTVVAMLVLLVPTMVWVQLRRVCPRLLEFVCLPLTIPAIVLVVGLARSTGWVSYLLGEIAEHAHLRLRRSRAAVRLPLARDGLAAIDRDPRRGRPQPRLLVVRRHLADRVPNIMGAIMSAALISVALVLGEFTISSLLNFETLQVAINLLGKRDASIAVAVSLAALLLAAALLFLLSYVDQSGRGRAHASGRMSPRAVKHAAGCSISDTAPAPACTCSWSSCAADSAGERAGRAVARPRPGRARGAARSVGLRQDHGAACARGSERLDSGRVLLDGRDITHMPASRRDMGMVFQAYSLFPHLTARDRVAFWPAPAADGERPAAARGGPAARARAPGGQGQRLSASALRRQQQRVALARALAIEPRVCSTSRSRRSTPRCARSCATRSVGFRPRSAPTTLFVTTIRTRRSPSPIA